MNKPILYIRIDDSITPPHIANICDEVDCRFNNLFCSFFGDSLVGDLKNETGTPLYKLFSPVGQLLCDFENANKEAYKILIKQWYEILALCAEDNRSEKPYLGIRIPQDYIDWLRNHVDFIFDSIADHISMSGNTIQLNRQDIIEEVIQESILKKITDAANSSDYKFLSFSNPAIFDESYIVKEYSKTPKSLTLLNSDHIIELNQRTDDLFIDLKEYLNGKSFIKHNHDSLKKIIDRSITIICSCVRMEFFRFPFAYGLHGLSGLSNAYDYVFRSVVRRYIDEAFYKVNELIKNYRIENEITRIEYFNLFVIDGFGLNLWLMNSHITELPKYESESLLDSLVKSLDTHTLMGEIDSFITSLVQSLSPRLYNDMDELNSSVKKNFKKLFQSHLEKFLNNIWEPYSKL